MASDTDFFRYKTTYPDGKEYFSRSYIAKGPVTSAINRAAPNSAANAFNIQKLVARDSELVWENYNG